MKVLLISVKSSKSRGGIATWTDRFLANCHSFGIECDIVNTEAVGKRVEQGTARRSLTDEFVRTKRIFKELKGYLKQSGTNYDVVHLNTSCGTFGLFRDYLLARRVKRKGLRLVTHFHCDIPFWINNSISRRFLGKLVELSDEKLVLCENSRLFLEQSFGSSSVKMPNFIDEKLILDYERNISKDLKKAFFVGRVSVAKGAKEIYELAKRFPDITFELVGDVSDDVALWEKPDNVALIGGMPHDEVIKKMDDADIFIFPSHSEGFSLALTEAMARGLPSIATDVGANRDMLEGGCGIVTELGDVDAMTAAIKELYSASVRKDMSCRAVQKVKDNYTTMSIITKIKDSYQNNE